MARPLDGIRVLDFTHVLAGPFCTRVLGDLGADVVKIGTLTRAATGGGPESPYYVMWNRNKRLLQLNLARPEGRQIARDLAAKADIIIDNFSVGVLDRWGLEWDSVAKTNPRVISIAMSGMGVGGPWSSYVTYAPTVHALAGLTYLTSVPGRNDIGIGFSYNDHMAGLHAAVALLAALEVASRDRPRPAHRHVAVRSRRRLLRPGAARLVRQRRRRRAAGQRSALADRRAAQHLPLPRPRPLDRSRRRDGRAVGVAPVVVGRAELGAQQSVQHDARAVGQAAPSSTVN